MNLTSFHSVMSELDAAGVPVQERPFVLMVAVARVAAYAAAIPADPVADTRAHFDAEIRPQLERQLAQINERVVLDIDLALRLTEAVWRVRYGIVHDQFASQVRGYLDAILRTGSKGLPVDLSEVLIRLPDSNVLDRISQQLYDIKSPD